MCGSLTGQHVSSPLGEQPSPLALFRLGHPVPATSQPTFPVLTRGCASSPTLICLRWAHMLLCCQGQFHVLPRQGAAPAAVTEWAGLALLTEISRCCPLQGQLSYQLPQVESKKRGRASNQVPTPPQGTGTAGRLFLPSGLTHLHSFYQGHSPKCYGWLGTEPARPLSDPGVSSLGCHRW